MQSDRLLTFIFSHQTLLIEGIFATILGIIVVWLFANLNEENQQNSPQNSLPNSSPNSSRNSSANSSSIDTQEIKKMLKKVLDGAATAPSPKAAPVVESSPPSAKPTIISLEAIPAAPMAAPIPTTAEVTSPAPQVITTTVGDAAEALKHKNEITDGRNKKVDELEKALSAARDDLTKMQDSSKNNEGLNELRKQIATLEGRLKEYAIIEDDIANLSAYKDENEKLKTEIALLKNKGARPMAEDILSSQTMAEITSAPLTVSPRAGDPAPSWPINEGESKKLLNEFDNLMSAQIKSATEEIIDQSNASDGEKLIAEFQNFMKGIN